MSSMTTPANPPAAGPTEPTPAGSPAQIAAPEAQAPAQPPAKEPELPLRLAIGLCGVLLASLTAILNEDITEIGLEDIRGALSIGNDDGTWVTAFFEATNVSTMIFAPWFGITFTLKRFTIGAVIAILA